jgi:PAS domain S-box-containing protein
MMKKSGIASAVLVLALLLPQTLVASEPKETKRVLVLYGEGKAHPAHELTDGGIRAVFRSSPCFDVQLYPEYLDNSRFGEAGHARIVADYLRRKYAGIKIDAIITVYPQAIDFLMSEEGKIFPEVPVVASILPRVTAESLERSPLRRFITAVVTGDNSAVLLDTALRLRPGTKHVALVTGIAFSDVVASEQVLRNALKPYLEMLGLIDLTRLPMQETLARVGSLPPDTIVLYGSIFNDGEGRSFVPREALSLVSRAANAPVFGLYESYLGYGIVGGDLVSWEHLGREAATLALRILGGESPGSIPFAGEHAYVSLYDWRELKRWNIPESAVPPGSEIRYREPSLWRDHKRTVVGMIALMFVESFLIMGLVVNLRMRRRAERALLESEERVRLAASSAGAGLWSLDVNTERLWASDKARELFGFALNEPLSYEMVVEAIHPEDREQVRQSVRQAIEAEQEVLVEYRIALPDGTTRLIASQGRFQHDSAHGSDRLMGVSVDITERKQVEEALRLREKELVTLTGRLISTQEEELRRLSRELHDDLTQRLAVLAMDAGMIEKQLKPLQTQAAGDTRDLKIRLIEVSQEVHDLSRQLHPSILDDLGLVQAVQSECAMFTKRTGIASCFEPRGVPDAIPDDIALCLYRVIQEGLRNIANHAETHEARLVLQGLDGGVGLSIQDFGVGFDVSEVREKPGVGLAGMRERVRLVGGTLSLTSEPGKGTEIRISIPLGGSHGQTARADRR